MRRDPNRIITPPFTYLSTSTTGPHSGHFNILGVNLNINIITLWHYGDSSRRSVDTPLRFSGGYSLHTVNTSLPLEFGIYHIALDFHDNILETPVLPG